MIRGNVSRLCVCGALLTVAYPATVCSQEKTSLEKEAPRPKADITSLMKELNHFTVNKNQMGIALWMPWEAFVELRTHPDGHDRETVGKSLSILKDYTIIILVLHIEKDDGARVFFPRETLADRVRLKLGTGEEFPLLQNVPPEILGVAQSFKERGAAKGGELGRSREVLFFSTKSRDGKTTLDTKTKNSLILTVGPEKEFAAYEFVWRTPFDATNPVPPCEKCNGPLSPKWSFCPWCGVGLK